MIKVCSRNMCAGTGWGGLWGLVVQLHRSRIKREESLQSAVAGVFQPPEKGCRTSRSELCQLLRGERSPLCLRRPQPICFQSPAVQRGSTSLRVHKHHRSGALYRSCFPAASPPPRVYYSAPDPRPKSSVGVVTGLIYSAMKGGSVEAHTGILCFQCGIHNHNPRFTPEADRLLYGCSITTVLECWSGETSQLMNPQQTA